WRNWYATRPMKRISNPPNPWAATEVEGIGEPPEAELEVYEEEVQRALAQNESPDVGFRWSLNPYRGCFSACAYCADGATPILMSDGTTKRLIDVRRGDEVVGVDRVPGGVEVVRTRVLDHWRVVKPAFRVALKNGAELVTSADHRFLTLEGWKSVGAASRSALDVSDRLVGVDEFSSARRRVVSVESLETPLPLYDISTGTGNFIANGVVSHNCYARSRHQYWGF